MDSCTFFVGLAIVEDHVCRRGRGTYFGAAMTACAAAGNGRPFKAAGTGRVSIGGLLSGIASHLQAKVDTFLTKAG